MDETPKRKLLDKSFTDLTLRDNLKINAVVIAVTAAGMAAWSGVAVLREKRQMARIQKNLEALEQPLDVEV